MTEFTHYPQYDIYTQADVKNILNSINKKYVCSNINQYQLMELLNDAADKYFLHRSKHDSPGNSVLEAQAIKFKKHAEAIISLLKNKDTQNPGSPKFEIRDALIWAGNLHANHVRDQGEPIHYIETPRLKHVNKYEEAEDEFRCGEILNNLIESLDLVNDWSTITLNEALNNKHPTSMTRHKPDTPLIKLVEMLSYIYNEITSRTPGFSKPYDDNKTTGPFPDFLQACLIPLNINKSSSALRSIWRRHIKDKS